MNRELAGTIYFNFQSEVLNSVQTLVVNKKASVKFCALLLKSGLYNKIYDCAIKYVKTLYQSSHSDQIRLFSDQIDIQILYTK